MDSVFFSNYENIHSWQKLEWLSYHNFLSE